MRIKERRRKKHRQYYQLTYAYYDLDDSTFFASAITFFAFSIMAGLIASPVTSSSSSPLSRDGKGVGETALTCVLDRFPTTLAAAIALK